MFFTCMFALLVCMGVYVIGGLFFCWLYVPGSEDLDECGLYIDTLKSEIDLKTVFSENGSELLDFKTAFTRRVCAIYFYVDGAQEIPTKAASYIKSHQMPRRCIRPDRKVEIVIIDKSTGKECRYDQKQIHQLADKP